ncbi:probable WRKY transcription factor 70 [Tanacetum coccineum]
MVGFCLWSRGRISESFYDGISSVNPGQVPIMFGVYDLVFHGNTTAPANKEREVVQRRKILDSRKEVSGTIGDGYSWRKYGQKEILNSKFPRCAHKHIQGCNALKQVQQLEDD